MKEKKSGVPKIFKKPVARAVWNKKYLGKIFLPEDRKFLEELAVEENGQLFISGTNLSKKDLKRLKELGKVIKANRKAVNVLLIALLVAAAAAAVLWQLVFKKAVVERVIETQLEAVFQAESEVEIIDFSVFGGTLTTGRLVIADSRRPMYNLAEFERVSTELDVSELLRGRVFIKSLGFSGLKRGTARTESGALEADKPDKPEAPQSGPGKPEADIPGQVADRISALLGSIDAEEILEKQKENLKSLKLIEQSRERVDGYAGEWEAEADKWENKIEEWESSVNYLKSVNPDSFSTVEGARTAVSRLGTIYNRAEEDLAGIEAVYRRAENQLKSVSSLTDEIRLALEADYEYLETLVTLSGSGSADWASAVIEDQLGVPLQSYLDKLQRGIEWYERYLAVAEKREEREVKERRSGRSLPEKGAAPPWFVLSHAFASGEEKELTYSVDLYDLTSDPERWQGVPKLKVQWADPATGSAEVVVSTEELSLNMPELPFDMGRDLEALGFESFSGQLSLVTEAGWTEELFEGEMQLSLPELEIKEINSEDLLTRLILRGIEAAEPLTAAGSFLWTSEDELFFEIETSLDEGLADAAGAFIEESAGEGLKMLEAYFSEQAAGPLAEFEQVKTELWQYVDEIEKYRNELDNYTELAEDKIAETEKAIADILKDTAGGVVDQVKEGIGDLFSF